MIQFFLSSSTIFLFAYEVLFFLCMEDKGPQKDFKKPLRYRRPLGIQTPQNLRKTIVKVNIALQDSKIKTLGT